MPTRRSAVPCLLLVVILMYGCAATSANPPRPARINHVVFFKLKNPEDAVKLIHDCDTKLATIPGVIAYFAGPHLETGRASVDADYDVGFYVGFMREDAYRGYVEHPAHIAVVEKWKPRLESLLVRDVLDETPDLMRGTSW
ncbi:MAG: Dabb family protein [Vicinamibacterales bacterium]